VPTVLEHLAGIEGFVKDAAQLAAHAAEGNDAVLNRSEGDGGGEGGRAG
jgi:hypothetical protein